MKLDSGELIATGAELSAAPGALGLDPSELSRLPRIGHTPTDEETVRAFLATLSDDFAAVYRAALETLARPDRVGVLHYSLGEESVSRAILAWGAPTGRGIVLMVAETATNGGCESSRPSRFGKPSPPWFWKTRPCHPSTFGAPSPTRPPRYSWRRSICFGRIGYWRCCPIGRRPGPSTRVPSRMS